MVEVAVSSIETDREKANIYAAANIPECWLVLPEEHRIEVLTQPAGIGYGQRRNISSGENLTSSVIPNLKLEVARLFASRK